MPPIGVQWLVSVILVVAGFWLVDRVLLWMERREWIYWRRRKGAPSRAGFAHASLELQMLLEPEKRYVLALRNEQKSLQDDCAAPPDPSR